MPPALMRSSTDVIGQAEPVATGVKVKTESLFKPADLSNLLLYIRAHRKTGNVTLHYSNGTLCVVQWNEEMK